MAWVGACWSLIDKLGGIIHKSVHSFEEIRLGGHFYVDFLF